MISARELKARKAKFGFDLGKIYLRDVIELGRFLEALQTQFANDQYIAEEAGYNQPEVKIYTDLPEVAEWIRAYKS
jgi:hypothetical protein